MQTPKGSSRVRQMFALHGWLGLSLGFVLSIICGSGAVAVFGHEIDWLLNSALRVTPGAQRVSLDARHAEVTRAFPEAKIAWWQLQAGPRFADEVEIYPNYVDSENWGDSERIYVDPYRGVIQGIAWRLTARSFLRAFHYYWFDRTGWGFYVVASFAFVLLGSVLTGMVIYRRWWSGLFRIRFSAAKRVFYSDLHRCFGAWTIVFNFIIALTAIYYLIEWIGGGHDWEKQTPKLSAARVAEIRPGTPLRSIDAQLESVQRAFPTLRVANISFAIEREDPLCFDGQATGWLVRERGNKILLDPYSGAVVYQHKAEDLSVGHRWVETVDRLHFGNFAGIASKILWFILGLMLPALFLTGAWLGFRRMGGLSRQTLRDWKHPLNAVGLIVSLALIAFATLSTVYGVKESLSRPAMEFKR